MVSNIKVRKGKCAMRKVLSVSLLVVNAITFIIGLGFLFGEDGEGKIDE